jgi:hypothetical protein
MTVPYDAKVTYNRKVFLIWCGFRHLIKDSATAASAMAAGAVVWGSVLLSANFDQIPLFYLKIGHKYLN